MKCSNCANESPSPGIRITIELPETKLVGRAALCRQCWSKAETLNLRIFGIKWSRKSHDTNNCRKPEGSPHNEWVGTKF